MVVHTSGFAPQDRATAAMHQIAVGRSLAGIPNSVWVWLTVGLFVVVSLTRSIFGRRVYAIGNCEPAAYLSDVDTRRVTLACFAISGACAAFSGVLLAGYSTHAYQAIGDPCPPPGDRRRGARRHKYPRRPRHIQQYIRWRNPNHAAAIDISVVQVPEAGRRDYLWGCHRRHAAALRPGALASVTFPSFGVCIKPLLFHPRLQHPHVKPFHGRRSIA